MPVRGIDKYHLNADLDFNFYSALNLKSAMGVVNVKGFGAKGDGVTDDTEAIRAALDALVSRGGGTLFFPAGTYILNGLQEDDGNYVGIEITSSKITIIGDGIGKTILKKGTGDPADNGSMHLIRIRGNETQMVEHIKISNLTLDGAEQQGDPKTDPGTIGTPWSYPNNLLDLAYTHDIDITGVEFCNCGNTGLYAENSSHVRVTRCKFENNYNMHLLARLNIEWWDIYHNTFHLGSNTACSVTEGEHCSIVGNFFHELDTNASINDVDDLILVENICYDCVRNSSKTEAVLGNQKNNIRTLIANNIIYNPSVYSNSLGILVMSTNVAGEGAPEDVIITNNMIYNIENNAIWIRHNTADSTPAKRVLVRGNIVQSCAQVQYKGGIVIGIGEHIIISDNNLIDPGHRGIQADITNGQIVNNNIDFQTDNGFTYYGIYISGGDGIVIMGNRVTNSGVASYNGLYNNATNTLYETATDGDPLNLID